jgi:hypothetical protein
MACDGGNQYKQGHNGGAKSPKGGKHAKWGGERSFFLVNLENCNKLKDGLLNT